MEEKKGFTFVELLAVIAILAILVVIAMPNVLKMFNNAKKDIFLTEVKTIFDETKKKYISESMKGNTITAISSKDNSKLDINGEDLDYCVILDSEGKVEKIAVGNKAFYIMLNNVEDINSLTKEDIKDGQLQDMECNPSAFKVKLNCEFDGELKQGVEYVNGQYTYRYLQEMYYDKTINNLEWKGISFDGWGVTLTNKESTEPVTSELCSSISNKPVISMGSMFQNSEATTIDLSSFDTSNVTNMSAMFYNTKVTNLNLSNFNTSNVADMSWMFDNSNVKTIDLSSFDTNKVTNMRDMFNNSQATEIKGLENFDTSNVINMWAMFDNSKVTTLDLSSFDTSNITDMRYMFADSYATLLDLSSFDTSNVTNMEYMFKNSKATIGYARTQADADKFNSTLGKPAGLTFVVK